MNPRSSETHAGCVSPEINKIDVAFIGGGLACTLTLLNLIRRLLVTRGSAIDYGRSRLPLQIAVMDRDGDFGCGSPYGSRAHPMLLLNENVATMNFSGFVDWLQEHRDDWMELLHSKCSLGVKNWLSSNMQALGAALQDRSHYLPLYFPRCIFGLFMREQLSSAITAAEATSIARVRLIRANAVSISRLSDGSFAVRAANGNTIITRVVILGVGSLPPESSLLEHIPGYVHDLLRPSPEASLSDVLTALRNAHGIPRSLAIVGSNAAAMEAIYAIRHQRELTSALHEIILLSPRGQLPAGLPSRKRSTFEPRMLKQLLQQSDLTADAVLRSAVADIEAARRSGYTSLDYSGPLIRAFSLVLDLLSLSERRAFVEMYGSAFTALNRHTPPEYARSAESFIEEGRLKILSARVGAVERLSGASIGFEIHATRLEGSSTVLRVAAVMNCKGSDTLANTQPPLLKDILKPDRDIARLNRCGRGIDVTETLEASPGVYVIGPLLSGHASELHAIWNLESAPRIYSLSQTLAGRLEEQLATLR